MSSDEFFPPEKNPLYQLRELTDAIKHELSQAENPGFNLFNDSRPLSCLVQQSNLLLPSTPAYIEEFSRQVELLGEALIQTKSTVVNKLEKELEENIHKVSLKEMVKEKPDGSVDVDKTRIRARKEKDRNKDFRRIANIIAAIDEKKISTLMQTVFEAGQKNEKAIDEALQQAQEAEEALKIAEEEERRRLKEEEEKRKEEEVKRKEEEEKRKEEEEKRKEEEEKRKEEEEKRKEREKKQKEEEKTRKEEEKRKEEQKQKEEEEKRKEEEEKRKEEEEKRKEEKENPDNRRCFRYEMRSSDFDIAVLNSETVCTVRTMDSSLSKGDLECHLLDLHSINIPLESNEQLMSNAVLTKPTNDVTLKFKRPVRIGLPFKTTAGNIGRHRDLVMRVCNEGELWQSYNIEESSVKDITVAEIEVHEIAARGIMMVVVNRPREDTRRVTSKGGVIRSSTDSSVSVTIPESACRLPTSVSLKVIPTDASVIAEARSHMSELSIVTAVSSVVVVQTDTPLRNVEISLRAPSKSGTSESHLSPLGGKRGTSIDVNQTGTSIGSGRNQGLHVLVKTGDNAPWNHISNVECILEGDSLRLSMRDSFNSVSVVQTSAATADVNPAMMTERLMDFIEKDSAVLVVKQHRDDPERVLIEVCPTSILPSTLTRIEALGYVEGPEPYAQLRLKEGSNLKVQCRHNIIFDEMEVQRLLFYRNLQPPSIETRLKVRDTSLQYGQDVYRGRIQLSLWKNPCDISEEPELLCEIQVTLPKKPPGHATITKADFHIRKQGILSETYLSELAGKLGNEWLVMAEHLGVATRGKSAKRENREKLTANIMDMFKTWFKKTKATENKPETIYKGLIKAGRKDLAADLRKLIDDKKGHKDEKVG